MKKTVWLYILLLIFSTCTLLAAEQWKKSKFPNWQTKVEDALLIAQKNNKMVFLFYTAPGVRSYSDYIYKHIFNRYPFRDLAEQYLIMVDLELDPARKTTEQYRYNQQMLKKYNILTPGSAVLLDSKGKIVDRYDGYIPPATYTAQVWQHFQLPNEEFDHIKSVFEISSKKGRKYGECSIHITHWGNTIDKVDQKFSHNKTIKIRPRQKLYFKVNYTMPENFKARLSIVIGNTALQPPSGSNKLISGTGSAIYSWDANEPWRINELTIDLEPLNKKFVLSPPENIPCDIFVDKTLFTEADFAAENKIFNELTASQIEIVAWGYTPSKVNTPFDSHERINLEYHQSIYLKIRYELPEDKKLRMGASTYADFGKILMPIPSGSGETVIKLTAPRKKRSAKNIHIMMQCEGYCGNINASTIPCRIYWRKRP